MLWMASECGVKRVELNSALSLGGLTPSLGSLIMIKQYSDIEVVSMVRARAGGFCYTNYQYEQMLENLKLLLAYGTDGVAFGFLNEDRTVDKNRCQEFLENVKNEGRKATFHRAFDCTRDPYVNKWTGSNSRRRNFIIGRSSKKIWKSDRDHCRLWSQ